VCALAWAGHRRWCQHQTNVCGLSHSRSLDASPYCGTSASAGPARCGAQPHGVCAAEPEVPDAACCCLRAWCKAWLLRHGDSEASYGRPAGSVCMSCSRCAGHACRRGHAAVQQQLRGCAAVEVLPTAQSLQITLHGWLIVLVRGAGQAATLGAAMWCRPARRCSSATWTGTAQPRQRPSTALFIAGRARCRAMGSGETLSLACYALPFLLEKKWSVMFCEACRCTPRVRTRPGWHAPLTARGLRPVQTSVPRAGQVHVCGEAHRRGGAGAHAVCNEPSCRWLEVILNLCATSSAAGSPHSCSAVLFRACALCACSVCACCDCSHLTHHTSQSCSTPSAAPKYLLSSCYCILRRRKLLRRLHL
jgi:hypothetical protein